MDWAKASMVTLSAGCPHRAAAGHVVLHDRAHRRWASWVAQTAGLRLAAHIEFHHRGRRELEQLSTAMRAIRAMAQREAMPSP